MERMITDPGPTADKPRGPSSRHLRAAALGAAAVAVVLVVLGVVFLDPALVGIAPAERRSTPPTAVSPEPSADAEPVSFPPLHMVVGGPYTDATGQVWASDSGALGGKIATTDASIDGTDDPRLYQQERWGVDGYDIALPRPGRYQVTLELAETHFGETGKRVFDVRAEGSTEVSGLDIYAAAGGKNRAMRVTFDVPVTDGMLSLRFSHRRNVAKVNALRIDLLEAHPSP